MLGDAAQKARHLQIGRWLLANVPAHALEDAICPIVDHLDRAVDRLAPDERSRVAHLNQRAGRIARTSAAYASALRYFSAGLELLPPEPWSTDCHELWFALVRDAAECAALTGDHARASGWSKAPSGAPMSPREGGAVPAARAVQRAAGCASGGHPARPGGAAILGVDLPPPQDVTGAAARAERERTRETLRGRSDRQLLEAGPMEDAEERARLRLLVGLAAATWFTAPELLGIVASRAVALTARRGVAQDSPFAFAAYAIALAMDSEYEEAHRFGRLAVGLAERASNPAQESRALMVLGGHVSPWRAPLRDSVPLLRKAYTRGIESGELEYAAYALANLVFALWFRGAPLDTVLTETDAALAFYRRIGHPWDPLRRAVHARREVPERPDARLRALRRRRVRRGGIRARDGRERARTGRLPRAAGAGLLSARRACARALVREEGRALAPVPPDHLLPGGPLLLCGAHALVVARRASLGGDRGPRVREHLRAARDLGRVARQLRPQAGPGRGGDRAHRAAPDALVLYDRAIAHARREGCGHEEALAHERCGRYLETCGHEAAEAHFRTAVDGYAAGERRRRSSSSRRSARPRRGRRSSRRRHGAAPGRPGLDLGFLLRATETLTSELVLDRLLEKLMPTCIEAAARSGRCWCSRRTAPSFARW